MRAADNAFASHRVEAVRYRLPGGWDALVDRLAALGHRAAVVGGHGSGKTSLLEALGPRLAARGFELRRVRLSRERPALAPADEQRLLAGAGRRHLLVVDGAEQLGRTGWRRLVRGARAAGGLVVTGHRRGPLPTLIECTTSPELLAGIVDELLADAPSPGPGPPDPAALWRRHRGNLRHALAELYDRWAHT
jgi:hypothetical protein